MGFGFAMTLTGLNAWRRLIAPIACNCQPLGNDGADEFPEGAGHNGHNSAASLIAQNSYEVGQ